jgi:hypothetical protein
MRQGCALGDAGRDRDRPVGARRDEPVDVECGDEPLDRRLVLRREDAAAVGVPEPGRRGIAVDDGDPQVEAVRRLEEAELRGAGA